MPWEKAQMPCIGACVGRCTTYFMQIGAHAVYERLGWEP